MIISKKDFKLLLNRVLEDEEIMDQLLKHNIDIIDSPLYLNSEYFLNRLLDQIVSNQNCREIISEYLYPSNLDITGKDRLTSPLQLFDDNDNVTHSITTIDDLYNYILGENGFSTNYRASN